MREYEENEDESSQKEVEYFFDEPDDQDRYLDMMEAGLTAKEIDQKMLEISLKMVEKSFFWRFYSVQTKIRKVLEVYITLNQIMDAAEQQD